jgi:hypothetical protein
VWNGPRSGYTSKKQTSTEEEAAAGAAAAPAEVQPWLPVQGSFVSMDVEGAHLFWEDTVRYDTNRLLYSDWFVSPYNKMI